MTHPRPPRGRHRLGHRPVVRPRSRETAQSTVRPTQVLGVSALALPSSSVAARDRGHLKRWGGERAAVKKSQRGIRRNEKQE